MAETREVFTPIEDSTGEGLAYVGKAPGAAQSTDEQAPVLPAVDGSSNLQNIPHRSVGDADSDGIPGFSFKDSSGNLVRPQLNSSGEIPVGEAGTKAHASAVATIAALNTEQDVAEITLAASDVVDLTLAMGSAFQPMLWIVYKNDDSTRTELARFVTGPGDFSHALSLSSGDIQMTAGATGTQKIEIRATQLRGKLTDAHATIAIRNLG